MQVRIVAALIVLAAAVWVLSRSVFSVDETQYVLGIQPGRAISRDYAPGLHFKMPLDRIFRVDRRSVARAYPDEMFVSSDGKTFSIDFYIEWRVADVARYFQATGGDEEIAGARLADIVRDRLKEATGGHTLAQIAASSRGMLNDDTFAPTNAAVAMLGVKLNDVEIQRIDLPDEAAESVYQRMQEGFNVRSTQTRATGASDADVIRTDADRKRTDTLANATRDAQRIRGEGDAQAASLYARAYGRNPEFAAFYRSLQAYRNVLGRDGDVLVLSPDGEFFKYLHSASGH